jgi:hypothetical protein
MIILPFDLRFDGIRVLCVGSCGYLAMSAYVRIKCQGVNLLHLSHSVSLSKITCPPPPQHASLPPSPCPPSDERPYSPPHSPYTSRL